MTSYISSEAGKKYKAWNSTLTRKAALPRNTKPLKKNSKPITRKTKINYESKKRAVENRQYSADRKIFLENNQVCVAAINGICTYVATQVHHPEGRIGKLLLLQKKWLPVCAGCHYWIEQNPREAISLGLSFFRHCH